MAMASASTMNVSDDFSDSSDDDFSPSEFSSCESYEEDDSDDEPLSAKRARLLCEEEDSQDRPSVWIRGGDFVPNLFEFGDVNSGINPGTKITSTSSELDCFRVFFNTEIMELIVMETNKHGDILHSRGPLQEKSKLRKWEETDSKELYVFLGICMLMALQKRPKISDYWSTDVLMANPMFGKLMSSLRFRLLMRALHFSSDEDSEDKLRKVRPIIDFFRQNFKNSYNPQQNLVIDESLMLWKGRLSFKQYIPSKRHRFGIKFFVLCDCQTGFVLDFIVYTGATTEIEDDPELGKSGSVVMSLMEPYVKKGHTLFIDNWYTSPALAEKLFSEKTGVCGTVRKNRKNMPSFPSGLRKGQHVEQHNKHLLAVKWHDRRDVHMLTSVDESGQGPSGNKDRHTREDIMKPKCVLNYNKNMGAIDKSDMQLSFVECVRKSLRWYKKFFFHLLDVACLNAYILHQTAQGKKREFSSFRLELVRQIVQEYHKPRKNPKGGRISETDSPLRLTERHFPRSMPPTEKKKFPATNCRVCTKTNLRLRQWKESRYMCVECDVGLCIDPCFMEYHTKQEF